MCEYCGCQALSTIDELTREHDRAVELIGHIRVAHNPDDLTEQVRLARELAAVLSPHTTVEEHGLFPAMAADFPEQIAQLEAEHRLIESVLEEAATGTPDSTWAARLQEALHLLRQHILKEQDGVFPAALANLSPSQWEAIETLRASVATTALPAPLAAHVAEDQT